MKITGTVTAGMEKVAKGMKDSVDNCKLDGKITEQQKRIKVLTKEIGNLAVASLDAGEEMSPEIMERYSAIKDAKEIITQLNSQKRKKTIVCENCGAKTAADMKYCGVCGTSIA
ncbi:MAG: hypothetical protein J6J79_00610 [Lachnospiraceae bacterium]|nr:hypothetical protein [Lachnospiraceae bacterium]